MVGRETRPVSAPTLRRGSALLSILLGACAWWVWAQTGLLQAESLDLPLKALAQCNRDRASHGFGGQSSQVEREQARLVVLDVQSHYQPVGRTIGIPTFLLGIRTVQKVPGLNRRPFTHLSEELVAKGGGSRSGFENL